MVHEPRRLITNTTPLITLSIACGHLDILQQLFDEVIVPQEVAAEITAGGLQRPGVAEFLASQSWLKPLTAPCAIAPYLLNTRDRGEASVIQTALDQHIPLVAIDEVVGRRVARLAGLEVTGSIGMLAQSPPTGPDRQHCGKHRAPACARHLAGCTGANICIGRRSKVSAVTALASYLASSIIFEAVAN